MQLNKNVQCVNRIIIKIVKMASSSKKKARKAKTKVLTKAKHKNLVTLIKEVNIDLLLEEVTGCLQQTFEDSTALKEFTNVLSKEKEPLHEIVEHHRSSFAKLYTDCKSAKTSESYMKFQLDWHKHKHCSAFLLEEHHKLEDIELKASIIMLCYVNTDQQDQCPVVP